MASTVEPQPGVEQAIDGDARDSGWTTAQSGSVAFAELVRTHFDWERSGRPDAELEGAYRRKLAEFISSEGELQSVYWATKRPSAVALTIKQRRPTLAYLADQDAIIRLHRVTDWLARERRIADLMHHCDTLAIKVSQVLRGTSERIAMQWIFAVQSHLLGFIERTQGRPSEKEIEALVRSQEEELIQIERYYARAGEKAARIVYFWGMMLGVLVDGTLALAFAAVLWATGWFGHGHAQTLDTFFVCYVSGGLGAIISVLTRMSSNKFRVDYEIGRPTIQRLGSFRPFIGAVFGIAVYFLIKSGIPNVKLPTDKAQAFFFLAVVAFLAGFNERWTNVLFGKAERTIAASLGGATQKPPDDDEEE